MCLSAVSAENINDLIIQNSSLEDFSIQDSHFNDLCVQDSSFEDFSIQDSSFEDFSIQDSSLENLCLQEQYIDADLASQDMSLDEEESNDKTDDALINKQDSTKDSPEDDYPNENLKSSSPNSLKSPDSGKIISVGMGNFSDIQKAIDKADPGDAIYLNGNFYSGNGSVIIIRKSISIIGNFSSMIPVILDAKGLSRIIYIGANDVNISNIYFLNGKTEGYGGAILWDGNRSIVKNSIFSSNLAFDNKTSIGGAIFWQHGGRNLISNCSFINNTAISGGAIGGRSGRNIISNCIFRNNKVLGDTGNAGALLLTGWNNTIYDSKFYNNHAEGYFAGAIGFMDYFEVYGCDFKDNNAAVTGGAIYWLSEGGIISNCNFENNGISGDDSKSEGGAITKKNFKGGTIVNSTFINNNARTGSAIYWGVSKGSIDACIFKNNQAIGTGTIYFMDNELSISNSLFVNNSANTGAALYSFANSDNITIENTKFINNTAKTDAGAIFFIGKNCRISNSLFENNRGTLSFSMGGAIYWVNSGNQSGIKNCTFIKNKALIRGGAIYCGNDEYSHMLIEDSNFMNNSVNNGGGAISIFGTLDLISGSVFEHNTANSGGAIEVLGNLNGIDGSVFINNYAGSGGAISISGNVKIIENSIFKCNKANSFRLEVSQEQNTFKCVFKGNENYTNAISSKNYVNFRNVTYWDGELVTGNSPKYSNCEAGINVTFSALDVFNRTILTVTKQTNSLGEVEFDEFRQLSKRSLFKMRYIISHFEDDYYTFISTQGNFTVSDFHNNTLGISVNDVDYGQYPVVSISTNYTGDYTVYISNYSNAMTFTDEDVYSGKALAYHISVTDENINDISIPIDKLLNAKDGYVACVQFDKNNSNYEDLMFIHNSTEFNVYKAGSSIDANETIGVKDSAVELNYVVENGTAIITGIKKGAVTLKSGTDYNLTVADDRFIIKGLDVGNYTVSMAAMVDGNHKPSSKSVSLRVINPTRIEVEESFAWMLGDEGLIGARLVPDVGSLSFKSDNPDILSVDNNGCIKANAVGNTTIFIAFAGNDDYAPSNATVKVSVSENPIPTLIKVNKSFVLYYNDQLDIGALLDPANAGSLSYASSNESVVAIDGSGKMVALGLGEANVTVSFAGNNKYMSSFAKVLVTVYPIVDLVVSEEVNVTSGEIYVKDKIRFTINVVNDGPSNATGVYVREDLGSYLTLSSKNATKGEYNGNVWNIGNLESGESAKLTIVAVVKSTGEINNNVTAYSNENDSNYANNVDKISSIIALPVVDLSINKTCDKAKVHAGDLIAYTINMVNSGPCNATGIRLNEILSPLVEFVSAKASFGTYDNETNVWIIDELSPNKKISLNLTVKAIKTGTIDNEIIVYSYEKDLNESNNNYKLSIECIGEINTVLTAANMTARYLDNKNFLVTLKDSNGTPLSGLKVSVDLNGEKNYTTDSNGQVKISTKNLVPDKYNATIRFAGNENYTGSNASASITINRIKTTFNYKNMNTIAFDQNIEGRVGEYFYFQLLDEDGKPLAGKRVSIGFNAAVYNRTTNETGWAKLQINLRSVNLYTFAIAFLGDDDYEGDFEVALINVTAQTPNLVTTNKIYKSTAKIKILTAAFISSRGTPIVGKKINFIVNGKKYTVKTNSKGIATLKVSLTRKGTYYFSVSYAGDSTYKKINKIKKLTIK